MNTKTKPTSLLKKKTLHTFLQVHDAWKPNKHETALTRTFPFPDYITGLMFIAQISVHAEVAGHHPDVTLSYGKVKVHLTTHDSNGLTEKDINLAEKIDHLYQ